jgi:DNA primase
MSLFAYLKQQLPIIDVISSYVPIKPAGHYWKGSCPFHTEKDASFTVSPDKQIFYCFGCHASGDVISFIAKLENMTQFEAAHHLIEKHGLSIPEHLLHQAKSPQTQEEKDHKERYYKAHKFMAEWCHRQLALDKAASFYASDRHLSQSTLELFKVGYFPSGTASINQMLKEAQREGLMAQDFLDSGIVMEGRAMLYSPFEERIVFPIRDSFGKYCGFGGRIFRPGDERPKYYNSKEADQFEKGRLLFGFDTAKKALHDAGHGFLVEGYMDCVMMVQYGYTNTVATLGTACTVEHLKQLSRLIHTLYILYDGDQAGQKAMLRVTELCWEVNLEVKVIQFPDKHDPASFLTEGNQLSTLIEQAQDIVSFFISSLGSHFTSKPLVQKMGTAEKIADVIVKISSQFKRDLLIHHAASVMQIPFVTFKQLVYDRARQLKIKHVAQQSGEKPAAAIEEVELAPQDEVLLLEEKIFSAILFASTTGAPVELSADIRPYFSEHFTPLLTRLEQFVHQASTDSRSVNLFLDTLSADDKDWVIRVSMQHDGQAALESLDHFLHRFSKHHWQRIVKDIKDELVKAKQEQNNQKVHDVLVRFAHLKQGMLQRGLVR